MALAPLAHVLWTRIMHYDPRDPEWPDRDRFVLSNGHACILQYSMLHLTGYDLSLEDLRQFRQWGSRTPGPPRGRATRPASRSRPGPLGQGFANAVGMAIAERWLRTTLRPRGLRPPHLRRSPATAASWRASPTRRPRWPGTSGLGRLLAFYDDNHITIDGPTELAYDDDVVERFEAYGWRVRNLGEMANDVDGLEAAIREALDAARRRPRRQADAARPAQPHRLALAPPHRHRRRPTASPSAPRRSGPPRRSWACRPTRRSGSPTRCATSTASEIARGAARHAAWAERFAAWDGDRAGLGRRAGRARAARGGPTDLPALRGRAPTLATRHAINQCIDATAAELPGPAWPARPT